MNEIVDEDINTDEELEDIHIQDITNLEMIGSEIQTLRAEKEAALLKLDEVIKELENIQKIRAKEVATFQFKLEEMQSKLKELED